MAQRIRVRCSHCGMMTSPENIENGPYPMEVFLQTFGGKVAGDPKGKGSGKGSAPGMMEYKDITGTVEGKRILKKIGH